jgi:N-hydroxyarylamine O-acetyltransferase
MVYRQSCARVMIQKHKQEITIPQAITIESYLQRIAYTGSLTPTLFNLNHLHLAHLQSVPFENLDITLGRHIVLELPAILDKIVNQNRGGFCYELNSAFAWLLREIGFKVKLLSARTYDGNTLNPEFDHLLLLVSTDQPVIADVGFGDSFLLPITPGDPVCFQLDRYYRLLNNEEKWLLQQRYGAGDWTSQYIFDMKPHPLHHFNSMCEFQQTSKSSVFTRKTVCSRATKQGRITYANGRYIQSENGHQEQFAVEDEAHLDKILSNQFGINLLADDLMCIASAAVNHQAENK